MKVCSRCGGQLLQYYEELLCLQCSFKPGDNVRVPAGVDRLPDKQTHKKKGAPVGVRKWKHEK